MIYLDASDELVSGRISGRRICSSCSSVYHVSDIGDSMECQRCGGQLVIREDDQEDKVKARLVIYKEKTLPLLDFFNQLGILEKVSGEATPEEVCLEISNKLSGIKKTERKNC